MEAPSDPQPAWPVGGDSLKPETVLRIQRHDRKYVQVANSTAQDNRLSWEARGLLLYLLSLPADWNIRVSHLKEQGNAGRDALRRILRELQTFGYASGVGRESQERAVRGQFGSTEIRVYETPALNPFPSVEDAPSPENQSTVGRPSTASPSPENPSPENPATYKEHNSQKTEGETKDTHTQPRARATSPPPEVAFGGVGVSSSKSQFSFEERKAHAERNGLGPGWLNNSRDGRYDELIADELARMSPEAVERALETPARTPMSYQAALLRVRAVAESRLPGSDPAAEIERIFEAGKIDHHTRERLLARDWTADAPAASPVEVTVQRQEAAA